MLSAEHRLRGDRNFTQLFAHGRIVGGTNFLIRFARNEGPNSRFAFVVSQKVSKKAVQRNLLRRRMREVVRPNLEHVRPGFDILLSAKKSALVLPFDRLQQEIKELLSKARLWQS